MTASSARIIAYGSMPYHKKPQRTLFGYVTEAARNARCHACVDKHVVDGFAADGALRRIAIL